MRLQQIGKLGRLARCYSACAVSAAVTLAVPSGERPLIDNSSRTLAALCSQRPNFDTSRFSTSPRGALVDRSAQRGMSSALVLKGTVNQINSCDEREQRVVETAAKFRAKVTPWSKIGGFGCDVTI